MSDRAWAVLSGALLVAAVVLLVLGKANII